MFRFMAPSRMILTFIGWLITVRKISSSSISQYMSGLRTVHLKHGVFPGNLRPDIVASIIKGREHEEVMSKKRIPRLAMTVQVMRLLKALMTSSNMVLEKKRELWVVCCMAFHGSFRIGELLSRNEGSFDPTTTLLGCNVRHMKVVVEGVLEEILVVHLKAPKEDRLCQGVNVELFSTGTFSCPVAAWVKWRKVAKVGPSPTKPVFRTSSGACMTGASFNKDIKALLGKVINYDEKKYLSHSFRSAETSLGPDN
jgi:hypothetical protein